jgi:hypothetical protein
MGISDEDFIQKGLSGLARAFEIKGMIYAHIPVAVLSGYYLSKNTAIAADVRIEIRRQIELLINSHQILFEAIDEPSQMDEFEGKIVNILKRSISRYNDDVSKGGHNVIYAAIILRVFKDFPKYFNKKISEGLCALIEHFDKPGGYVCSVDDIGKFPVFIVPESIEDLVVNTFLAFNNNLGFHGHILTHGHALTCISRLGYESVAELGFRSHLTHIIENHNWLNDGDNKERYKITKSMPLHPSTLEYWKNKTYVEKIDRVMELCHHIKYTYGIYEMKTTFPNMQIIDQGIKNLNWYV